MHLFNIAHVEYSAVPAGAWALAVAHVKQCLVSRLGVQRAPRGGYLAAKGPNRRVSASARLPVPRKLAASQLGFTKLIQRHPAALAFVESHLIEHPTLF